LSTKSVDLVEICSAMGAPDAPSARGVADA
jgi:hypothetical protein